MLRAGQVAALRVHVPIVVMDTGKRRHGPETVPAAPDVQEVLLLVSAAGAAVAEVEEHLAPAAPAHQVSPDLLEAEHLGHHVEPRHAQHARLCVDRKSRTGSQHGVREGGGWGAVIIIKGVGRRCLTCATPPKSAAS